jgi:hypothetical protein
MFERVPPAIAWFMLSVMLSVPIANDLALAQALADSTEAPGPGLPAVARNDTSSSPLAALDTTSAAQPNLLAAASPVAETALRDSTASATEQKARTKPKHLVLGVVVLVVVVGIAVGATLGIISAIGHASTL